MNDEIYQKDKCFEFFHHRDNLRILKSFSDIWSDAASSTTTTTGPEDPLPAQPVNPTSKAKTKNLFWRKQTQTVPFCRVILLHLSTVFLTFVLWYIFLNKLLKASKLQSNYRVTLDCAILIFLNKCDDEF